MPLQPGTTLGPYSVTAKIGEGGMGEVYRARDTKLDRDVALKVLPQAFVDDPDRLARFEREAKVLASLNHTNIGHLYGLEEADGQKALVLELVEGPTLADKIAQGPIPVDEALPIAKQIAEALEVAHEQGIIHRDLKPANIKVRDDGTVKVLDFGLAKAFEPSAPDVSGSMSPTISLTAAATQMGMVIGTAAYMAPEQAKGLPVDRRADIWAFGAVLFEMLTGKKLFETGDVSEMLASVLVKDPDISSIGTHVPEHVRSVIRHCLVKDPKERLRDIGDVRLAMKGVFETTVSASSEATTAPPLKVWQRPVNVAASVAVALVVGGLAVWMLPRPALAPPRVQQFAIPPPGGAQVGLSSGRRDIAITPDGSKVVYTVTGGNPHQFLVRSLDELTATPLEGAGDTVYEPFISPDGAWVGFLDAPSSTLQRISILGGPAVEIGSSGSLTLGATWMEDDTIIFGNLGPSGLWHVPASGGEPEELTSPDEGVNHAWPHVLPGSRAVLFAILTDGGIEQAQIAVLDLETGDQRVLISGGSGPRYAPTGHIVYGVNGTLRAVVFDLDRLEVTNPNPVPVLDGVVMKGSGAVNFDLARDGSLVYMSGEGGGIDRELVWVDRQGREESLGLPANNYFWPRLSPEGTRLAVGISGGNQQDVWISDIARRSLTPLTIAPELDNVPLWTPDGQQIVFASRREGGQLGFFSKRADGTGPVEMLMMGETTGFLMPYSWSSDGRTLAFGYQTAETGADIGVLSMEGDREWQPLLQTTASEFHPAISPSGEWIAYTSTVSGQLEVYVERFPDLGGRVPIATGTGSGRDPHWSPAGDELFYRRLDGAVIVVPIDTTDETQGLVAGTPEVLFEDASFLFFGGVPQINYDLSPDGERFLMLKSGGGGDGNAEPTHVILFQNWTEELKRLVPVD